MFKKLLLTFFLLVSSFITIYPSRKENTKLFDYCYPLEKILSRNAIIKSKNISKKVKTYAKDMQNDVMMKLILEGIKSGSVGDA